MTTRPPICFYHSADLDGKCSGAIVKRAIPEVELRGYNYGDEFPWAEVEGRDVIMVDVSLQPFGEMTRLFEVAKTLLWIDHHKSAIDSVTRSEINKLGHEVVLEVGMAACELTWRHYFPSSNMPDAVHLLGRYDVRDHCNEGTLPFQFGMRVEDNDPDSKIWNRLLANDARSSTTAVTLIDKGETILSYQTQQNAIYAKARSFETEIDGHHAIACNAGLTNSQLFDSVWDPEHHAVMLLFSRKPNKTWTVSLYSTLDGVDCGAIAKAHGGGGHKGAADFQCTELPFEF